MEFDFKKIEKKWQKFWDENSSTNLLDTKKFLGWPLSHEYAGYSLQKKLIGIRSKKTGVFKNVNLDTMISNLDHHPNAKGHEKIAEFIYERL